MLMPATVLSSLKRLITCATVAMYSSWMPARLYQKLVVASNTAGFTSRWPA